MSIYVGLEVATSIPLSTYTGNINVVTIVIALNKRILLTFNK